MWPSLSQSACVRRSISVGAASYAPTWVEVAVSLGILAYAPLAFTLGVKYLPLFHATKATSNPATPH
jgi:Ni/Fe-hydrogenase subunit HybB-like protein